MNRTQKLVGLTLLLIVIAVIIITAVENSPTLLASVGWHGDDQIVSVGWHGRVS